MVRLGTPVVRFTFLPTRDQNSSVGKNTGSRLVSQEEVLLDQGDAQQGKTLFTSLGDLSLTLGSPK